MKMEMNVHGRDPRNRILNPMEVSALVQKDRTDQFIYIKHAFKRCSKFFTSYDFKLVSHKDVNQSYMTVSANGVTQYTIGEMFFMPLSIWSSEYKKYLKLMELRLFRCYQMWKAFYVWSKTIKTTKILKTMKYIEENLFLCDEDLREALLKITEIQWPLAESNFLNLSHTADEPTVFQFIEMQFTKIEEMKKKLKVLRESAVAIVVRACMNSISHGGCIRYPETNEYNKKLNNPRSAPSKSSFIEEARKKNKINQLSRFIRLADYITIFLLLKLLENTYIELLKAITEHRKLLPDVEKFKNNEQLNVAPEDKTLFIAIDVILSDDGDVTVDPGIEILYFIINKIQTIWEEELREILESHTTITRFQNSMRPVIDCGQFKSGSSSDASRLSNVIKSSLPIWDYKTKLNELLNSNTTAIQLYCKRFDVIETFYKETKACPTDMIQRNESSEMFRNWCFEYKMKEEEINEIGNFQLLGIFSLQLGRLRNETLSLTLNNQRILGEVIPKIGKSKVDILLSKILDATTYLDTDPTTADNFAIYVDFIDDVQQRIDNIELDADYIKELYDITEEYGIQVDAGDFANYLVINVALTSFKIAVAKRLKERDKLISRFNEQISNDVRKLTDQVSVISDLISELWLLDATSDANTCLKTLNDFNEKLQKYTKIVDKYRDYQKSFDLEIIRFDILDHVRNEIHLRALLWECIIFWTKNSHQWYESDFNDLNTEEIASITEKYLQNVDELERGLGRQPILFHLKGNVEYIRDKLPVINFLRNKHLRRRHWLEIETILNYKFKQDTRMTLKLIENLGAFAHPQEFRKISERATSEANHEAILNRIDDGYRNVN